MVSGGYRAFQREYRKYIVTDCVAESLQVTKAKIFESNALANAMPNCFSDYFMSISERHAFANEIVCKIRCCRKSL